VTNRIDENDLDGVVRYLSSMPTDELEEELAEMLKDLGGDYFYMYYEGVINDMQESDASVLHHNIAEAELTGN